MQGYRSEDPGVRLAASQMTRSMTDISDDEGNPSYRMSTSQFFTTLDDDERAVTVGKQLVKQLEVPVRQSIQLVEALQPAVPM